MCFAVGNALSKLHNKANVCIGRDTRLSGTMVLSALCAGITSGGGNVCNVGVMPTAGVAYLTSKTKSDLGVVISASHNPFQYNGIKVFTSDGYKLTDQAEMEIERLMEKANLADFGSIGQVKNCDNQAELYIEMLLRACSTNLSGLKIVLDCSNGAASYVAPRIFTELGAKIFLLGCDMDSGRINDNCGCLHPQIVAKKVLENKADVGFAYDGDSDRLVAIDKDGEIIDGDMIVYMLANHYKLKNKLVNNLVVGTQYTNMGFEKAYEDKGMKLLRSEVGDKYVIQLMRQSGAVVGGEQSGHIILGDISTTGDGILCSVLLAGLINAYKKPFRHFVKDISLFSQRLINVKVKSKAATMQNPRLIDMIKSLQQCENGRLLVRASGTEPKIRVMAEYKTKALADSLAEKVAACIADIECFDE